MPFDKDQFKIAANYNGLDIQQLKSLLLAKDSQAKANVLNALPADTKTRFGWDAAADLPISAEDAKGILGDDPVQKVIGDLYARKVAALGTPETAIKKGAPGLTVANIAPLFAVNNWQTYKNALQKNDDVPTLLGLGKAEVDKLEDYGARGMFLNVDLQKALGRAFAQKVVTENIPASVAAPDLEHFAKLLSTNNGKEFKAALFLPNNEVNKKVAALLGLDNIGVNKLRSNTADGIRTYGPLQAQLGKAYATELVAKGLDESGVDPTILGPIAGLLAAKTGPGFSTILGNNPNAAKLFRLTVDQAKALHDDAAAELRKNPQLRNKLIEIFALEAAAKVQPNAAACSQLHLAELLGAKDGSDFTALSPHQDVVGLLGITTVQATALDDKDAETLWKHALIQDVLGKEYAKKIAAIVAPNNNVTAAQLAMLLAAKDAVSFKKILNEHPAVATLLGFTTAQAAELTNIAANAIANEATLKNVIAATYTITATTEAAAVLSGSALAGWTAKSLGALLVAADDAAIKMGLKNNPDVAEVFRLKGDGQIDAIPDGELINIRDDNAVRTALEQKYVELAAAGASQVLSATTPREGLFNHLIALFKATDAGTFKTALEATDGNNDIAAIVGLDTAAQARLLPDSVADALRSNVTFKNALKTKINDLLSNLFINKDLSKLDQAVVEKIATAKDGKELKEALSPIDPNIATRLAGIIDDGDIATNPVNAPFLKLRHEATACALKNLMDTARHEGLVSAIAHAQADSTSTSPTAHPDAIRSAILDTHGLEPYIGAKDLGEDAANAIQEHAIAKYNELKLLGVFDRVLEDENLLQKFINAHDHDAQRALLNDKNNNYHTDLCIPDSADPSNTLFTLTNLSDKALDNLTREAYGKLQYLTNHATRAPIPLRQKLNVGIEEGDTKYGYYCKQTTEPEKMQALTDAVTQAAQNGGAALAPIPERKEIKVNADHLTIWRREADTNDSANPKLNVGIVRHPNGAMRTTNTSAELKTLTTVEKQALAKQMAQEYIANMIEGKGIYIKCGDKELASMLYAAVLVIQMDAQRLISKDAQQYKPLIGAIADLKIFLPVGVKSLSDSKDSIKESFVTATLGNSIKELGTEMTQPALQSYADTSKKMVAYNKAQDKLSKAERKFSPYDRAKSEWYERDSSFHENKVKYTKARDAAKTKAEQARDELLAKERDTVDKPRGGGGPRT